MAKIYTFPAYVCGPHIYAYKGWLFEFGKYTGPWPLKKDFELRSRAGKKFWQMFDEFMDLPADQQMLLRVGGGCERF